MPLIMRLLIDENVDVKIVRFLKKLGHNAVRTPSGTKNGAVMRLAVEGRRILVTRDSDFTDSNRFPPGKCPGIIYLDVHPPHFARIAPPLQSFLAAFSEDKVVGRLFILNESGFDEFS